MRSLGGSRWQLNAFCEQFPRNYFSLHSVSLIAEYSFVGTYLLFVARHSVQCHRRIDETNPRSAPHHDDQNELNRIASNGCGNKNGMKIELIAENGCVEERTFRLVFQPCHADTPAAEVKVNALAVRCRKENKNQLPRRFSPRGNQIKENKDKQQLIAFHCIFSLYLVFLFRFYRLRT